MIRSFIYVAILAFFSIALTLNGQTFNGKPVDFDNGKLKVTPDGRGLMFENGKPFFYLGETAWEMFHRLTIEETEKFLENRRQKGFTVIQAVALAELDGLNTPNRYGEKPLINNDPTKPNEAYFKHIDRVIEIAFEKGMFMALLPTWGDKLEKMPWGGIGPEVFNPENAYRYGKFIGNRYKNTPNIIWVIGGDRFGADEGGDFGGPRVNNWPTWDAMARGIKSVDTNHLMTFHPIGGNSSSQWFHNAEWLDFNMIQSGHHERSYTCTNLIKNDYNLVPVKPTFDAEPRYEDHPIRWQPDSLGWFNEMHVRQIAYWNLFSGGFGHTYGCHPVWQFHAPGYEPIGHCRNYWYDVLDLHGAQQMLHVRRLMESRPLAGRIPYSDIVLNPGDEYTRIVATKGDGYIMVYSAQGYEIELNNDLIPFDSLHVWWFCPRTGKAKNLGVMPKIPKGPLVQPMRFSPPSRGPGFDWVLVLNKEEKNFQPPGFYR